MVPRRLLFFLPCLLCVPAGSDVITEHCILYRPQINFEVFSVPGDVAMLNSKLLSASVFPYTTLPYNITWYSPFNETRMVNQTGRFLLRRETLWLLNVTLEDAGNYVCVVRSPSGCFHQVISLVVDPAPGGGECGRPQKVGQMMTNMANVVLTCPLTHYVQKLQSYGITSTIRWYKGCSLIEDGRDRFVYQPHATLNVERVSPDDEGFYTCTLTFDLAGVTGQVSETIDVGVNRNYVMLPMVHAPANEVMKAEIGSSFSQLCRVFVPCIGDHGVKLMWLANGVFIHNSDTDRVYPKSQPSQRVEGDQPGNWEELLLVFREVLEEDLHMNYTCRAISARGFPNASFTLLPAEPNLLVPIALSLVGGAALFISTAFLYHLFKLDVVLWFRRAFPVFYRNTECDGKQFDAYVMFPGNAGKAVESFSLQALPVVLERGCGHKLFIPGRDSLPGHAMVDSVEENMRASRRLVLIYTASSFAGYHDGDDEPAASESASDGMSRGEGQPGFDCQLAMHKALLEESLKVLLVEMEELGPNQLALLPPSLLHLRKRQGALCWWKSQRRRRRRRRKRSRVGWGSCGGRDEEEAGEEEEGALDWQGNGAEDLSPSSRFWKEMRYHMPVRGKRSAYPQTMGLLNRSGAGVREQPEKV